MTDVVSTPKPFPNYTELRRRIPVGAWHPVRIVSVAVFLGLCVMLWIRPAGSLFFFWNILVPLLPITFMVAPGFWRNVCPLAAANQAPRLWGFTRGLQQPAFLRNRGYIIAIALFAAIMSSRKPLFDHNGAALSILLFSVIVGAFVMGATFKGKSGWCSSMCPLLPVQRLYGQTPFVTVPNSHCQPCVGCTKNCYDFNPGAAYQADMHEPDVDWAAPRTFFAGAFPGLIYGFFSVPSHSDTIHIYGHIFVWAAVGAGILYALDALLPLTSSQVAALGGAAAINFYYWYRGTTIFHTYSEVFNADLGWMRLVIRTGVPIITALWLWRTFRVERRFKEQAAASARPVKLSPTRAAKLHDDTAADGPEVIFLPEDHHVVAAVGATLLEVAESDGLPIEAGCRMGMCGSDPVAVLDGMDNLSPVTDDEATTLRRLGLGPNARMACSARVNGLVCVSLALDSLAGGVEPQVPVDFDHAIERVVVLGNGIAGVTAADFVRRNHPECEIHVVGKEAHHLYNRMGISRIVYGRSAMLGLSLLPDAWYDDNRITCWLNTRAQRIDVGAQAVVLATGETLPYDRLILATGSASFVPPIRGYGMAGTFVLREADDAIGIRRYAQEAAAAQAVVAGGGLLGLEAAHSLHALGLSTTVVELAPRLLMNQADERASELLADYLENLGIGVVTGTSIAQVVASEDGTRVRGVTLADGRDLPADVFLVAAGIKPNVDLARDAGIEVNRGIVVDDRMRTSAPNVYAAGDVAEIDGRVLGLWPIAVNQAEVAARNALGADEAHVRTLPLALLKGVGLDLLSAGRINPTDGDEAFVFDNGRRGHQYAKVVVGADGRVVGGLLLGRPQDHAAVTEAVKKGELAAEFFARWDVAHSAAALA
jgi:NADPH-dependent 2,4-dienoyl-CoA reductase/sulfur reductase-like enzyme/ferredoxin